MADLRADSEPDFVVDGDIPVSPSVTAPNNEETALLDPLPSSKPLSPPELLELPVSELSSSLDTIESSLSCLTDSETIDVCTKLLRKEIKDVEVAETILRLGLARCEMHVAKLRSEIGRETITAGILEEDVRKVIGSDKSREEHLTGFATLFELQRRLETYQVISSRHRKSLILTSGVTNGGKDKLDQDGMNLDDPWSEEQPANDKAAALLEDPWGDSAEQDGQTEPDPDTEPTAQILHSAPPSPTEETPNIPPIELSIFVNQPIPLSALQLAASASISHLKTVCERHLEEVHPFRLAILAAVPVWVSPVDLETEGLLLALGEGDTEKWLLPANLDKREPLSVAISKLYLPAPYDLVTPTIPACQASLSSSELTQWYTEHISSLDSAGLLDIQLAWVQHGASLGVVGLDQLGEDLSLLSRLVYDANLTVDQHARWNLAHWRKSSQEEIIQAYLSNATSEDIVADIKRLVLPYLYVLESRAERAGQADPTLVERLLHGAILSLPLDLALPVFEASKATLPASGRIVKNDLDVARLALACLYGSEEKEAAVWSTMSSIFECLPVWELSGTDPESDAELTSTTLDSIATFVRPTSASAPPPTSRDLFVFFHPLPFASLSRALDILDVHLESGEILARWNVPTQLRFLLQSARDSSEQKELAEKMVRRQRALGEDGWRRLWDEMGRLAGGEDSGLLRGALGMLNIRERGRIYLGGLISSGNFDTARKMIKKLTQSGAVDDDTVEEVALTTSKEFYLSADSGNIHTGEMKLAYDCLSVAPATPKISSEKSYMEATSRLASFSTLSLTPLEIRQTSDPLSLISRVLESSDDAYKYPDMMLDLSSKLGAKDEVDKGLVWCMIGKAAERFGDYKRAKQGVEGCVEIVRRYKLKVKRGEHGTAAHKRGESSSSTFTISGARSPRDEQNQVSGKAATQNQGSKLVDEAWRLSYTLANEAEYSDIPSKLKLISYALEFVPPSSQSEIPNILAVFRRLEDGRIKLDQASKRRRLEGIKNPPLIPSPSIDQALSSDGQHLFDGKQRNLGEEEERVLGSRTAAKAAKLALDFSGKFGVGNLRNLTQSPKLGHEDVATSSQGRASPVLGYLGSHLPISLPSRSSSAARSRSPNPNLNVNTSTTATMTHADTHVQATSFLERVTSRSSDSYARPPSSAGSTGTHETHGHTPRELFESFGVGGGVDEAERVRQNARRALVRGVGWLLGAEEGEITGD
ncbi:hypothetical protein I316_03621 [Kwoniella heveanensis BCC8398]|uniref:Sec39 domain-containing protein n=1 Tax=Kwoniella heveanensis BCC8398 TaxID=1296120 RepID=A0A1B9GU67_9TREE|nr:hypothetical protein I316_03621 [Kwoniella heveanensis BCC8398]